MLQSLRDYATSTKLFERACATTEEVLGKEHVLTATGYHVLARSYTLEGNFPKALAAERIAFDVFEKKLGPEDARTKDSDLWLKELTTNAVIVAQRAREEKDNAALNSTTTPVSVPEPAQLKPQVGELPIDQVMQFINGDSSSKSKKGAQKKSQKKQRK